MEFIKIIVVVFSGIAALDRIFGSKLGLGKEFDKAFMLMGPMCLSMIGMIVLAPYIGILLMPASDFLASTFHIDPSIIPASLFANDMGGAPLSVELGKNEDVAMFNALVVSSMMGCTVSFTIPFSLGVVKKEQHRELILGLLSGIVTIPLGCFVSGIMCKLPLVQLVVDLIPLVVFSVAVAVGLLIFPDISVKVFKAFGGFITALITVGLAIGIVHFLAQDNEMLKNLGFGIFEPMVEKGTLDTLVEGALVCANAAVVLSGTFPFMYALTKILAKPLRKLSSYLDIDEVSIVGLLSCIASNATSFGMMDKMGKKGTVLNSAFAVSAAFTVGSHLAFTMAFEAGSCGEYVVPLMTGKVIAGILSLFVASVIYARTENKRVQETGFHKEV